MFQINPFTGTILLYFRNKKELFSQIKTNYLLYAMSNGIKKQRISSDNPNDYFVRLLDKKKFISSIDYNKNDKITTIYYLRTHKGYENEGYGSFLLSLDEKDSEKSIIYLHEKSKHTDFLFKRGYKYSFDYNGELVRCLENNNWIQLFKKIEE